MDRRIAAWFGTAILFAALYAGVPLAGLAIDRTVGLSPLSLAVRLVGSPLLFVGVAGLLWCFALFARARGTPNPVMPPEQLVTAGPYAWTRNPIAGSHFLAVLGVALIVGSPAAVAITFLLGIPADLVSRLLPEKKNLGLPEPLARVRRPQPPPEGRSPHRPRPAR